MSDLIKSRFAVMDSATVGRLPLAIAGVRMALSYPLGLGAGGFLEKSEEFYYDVSNMPGSEIVLTMGTHNQFINTAVGYGVAGFLLLLMFVYMLFKYTLVLAGSNSSFYSVFGRGMFGAFVSYSVNSSFHNAGFLYGDVTIWYFIGLFFAILSMYSVEQSKDIYAAG